MEGKALEQQSSGDCGDGTQAGWKRPLPSRWTFAKRLAKSCGVAALVVGPSLLGGMAGYHYFENMEWIDAFANASMILSGMGPMKPDLTTRNGKLFAGFYALYSGLVLIVAAGLIFAPIVHRVMHRFHLESEDADGDGDR
jgi:hypothetical protein